MSRDVPKLPGGKGCKWRHNHRKCRNKVACPLVMSTGDQKNKISFDQVQRWAWYQWNPNSSLKWEKKSVYLIFCHNFPQMVCNFQNLALQLIHPVSKTVLFSLPHSCLYNLLKLFKPETICNGTFCYTTLCGTTWSLWALLVNVNVVFPKLWMAGTAHLTKGW